MVRITTAEIRSFDVWFSYCLALPWVLASISIICELKSAVVVSIFPLLYLLAWFLKKWNYLKIAEQIKGTMKTSYSCSTSIILIYPDWLYTLVAVSSRKFSMLDRLSFPKALWFHLSINLKAFCHRFYFYWMYHNMLCNRWLVEIEIHRKYSMCRD